MLNSARARPRAPARARDRARLVLTSRTACCLFHTYLLYNVRRWSASCARILLARPSQNTNHGSAEPAPDRSLANQNSNLNRTESNSIQTLAQLRFEPWPTIKSAESSTTSSSPSSRHRQVHHGVATTSVSITSVINSTSTEFTAPRPPSSLPSSPPSIPSCPSNVPRYRARAVVPALSCWS